MTVSSIASLTSLYATQQSSATQSAGRTSRTQAPPPPPGGGGGGVPGHIQTAAEVLGLSTDKVTQALKNGSSLAGLAEQQGVSRDDLIAALVADAPEGMQASGNIEEIVANLVDQTGMGGPGGGRPPEGSTGVFGQSLTASQQSTVDLLSSLVGTSSSSLLSALRSGTSLTSLLTDAGVSHDALVSTLESGVLIDTSA